jgi:hypothetical protein
MKKILLTLFFLIGLMKASDYSIDAQYDIYYGFFGTVGEAKAFLSIENKTYKIRIKAKATGLAKVISRNRIEVYESTGVVKDGMLVPDIFVVTKTKEGRKDIKRYMFDHNNKKVNLLRTESVANSKSNSQKDLPYYTQNDILTLFFNLKLLLGKNFTTKEQIHLVAVGASDKNGKIDINSHVDGSIAKLLGANNHLLSVVLNQRIFASQKGEMFINLNDDGICTSALLKDVVMFGDIRGKLKKLKVTK